MAWLAEPHSLARQQQFSKESFVRCNNSSATPAVYFPKLRHGYLKWRMPRRTNLSVQWKSCDQFIEYSPGPILACQ